MAGLCHGKHSGRNTGCPWPAVEGGSGLCARHLLVAASEVEELGRAYLESVVRSEGLTPGGRS